MEAFLPINSSVESKSSICKTIDEPSAPPEVQNQILQHQHCPLAWKLAGEVTFLWAMSLRPYQWLWLLKKSVFVKRNELQNTKCLGLSDLPLIHFVASFQSRSAEAIIFLIFNLFEGKVITNSHGRHSSRKKSNNHFQKPKRWGKTWQYSSTPNKIHSAPEEHILSVKISVIFHY